MLLLNVVVAVLLDEFLAQGVMEEEEEVVVVVVEEVVVFDCHVEYDRIRAAYAHAHTYARISVYPNALSLISFTYSLTHKITNARTHLCTHPSCVSTCLSFSPLIFLSHSLSFSQSLSVYLSQS